MPLKSSNVNKGKTPIKSCWQILLDLASTLQGPLSDSASNSAAGSVAGSGPGSIDLFSEVVLEVSTAPNRVAPNSTSPSEGDDDSIANKHYNPDKDAN